MAEKLELHVDTKALAAYVSRVEDMHHLQRLQGRLAFALDVIRLRIRELNRESRTPSEQGGPAGIFQMRRIPADGAEPEPPSEVDN